jgi:hypothetical protein
MAVVCRSLRRNRALRRASPTSPTTLPRSCPQDRQQDACPNESDNDAAQHTKRAETEQACQKPTNEGPDEAHHDITHQPIAAAAHHPAGEEASNQPNHQPEQNAERIERDRQGCNDCFLCHTLHMSFLSQAFEGAGDVTKVSLHLLVAAFRAPSEMNGSDGLRCTSYFHDTLLALRGALIER